jgi:hypothetical protein
LVLQKFKLVNSVDGVMALFLFRLLGLVGVGVGVGVGSTTLGASTTVDGDGMGVGLTATFLTTGFLETGFLATVLEAGFFGAEKEGAGNSNVNERARIMYFFIMPFSRFILSCTMESKGSTS